MFCGGVDLVNMHTFWSIPKDKDYLTREYFPRIKRIIFRRTPGESKDYTIPIRAIVLLLPSTMGMHAITPRNTFTYTLQVIVEVNIF